jgi:hypothetical protein
MGAGFRAERNLCMRARREHAPTSEKQRPKPIYQKEVKKR